MIEDPYYEASALPLKWRVESLAITAIRMHNGYWHMTICPRRANETWQETRSGTYDMLGTGELLDVIQAELIRELTAPNHGNAS